MKTTTSFIAFCFFLLAPFAYAQDKTALFPLPNAEGKWGYVDAQKNVKIAYQFDVATPFFEERAFVLHGGSNKENPGFSVIDMQGKLLFDVSIPCYDSENACLMDYTRYSEGLLHVRNYQENTNKYTFYDKQGKLALSVPCANGSVMGMPAIFSEGLAYIMPTDSTWAYIDKTGKIILKGDGAMNFPFEAGFYNGWAVSYNQSPIKLMNKKGVPASFLKKYKVEDLGIMREGYGFMAGKLKTDAEDVTDKVYIIQPNGTVKPVNIVLENSSPVTFVSGYSFSEGLAHIRYFKKTDQEYMQRFVGYLNTDGKLAFDLPAMLQQSEKSQATGSSFYNGLACWRIGTWEEEISAYKVVYINTKGAVVFESPTILLEQ